MFDVGGVKVYAKKVILTTGTFLGGVIHIGYLFSSLLFSSLYIYHNVIINDDDDGDDMRL